MLRSQSTQYRTADRVRRNRTCRGPERLAPTGEHYCRRRYPGAHIGCLGAGGDKESGISLQRTSPTIGAILVRGLTEVGVYIDGIRYTNSTQRSGINTFFNLNDPTNLQTVEILRGPNTAQYGSDSLGGLTHLISRQPGFSTGGWNRHGELNTFYSSADNSFGSNAIATFASERFGMLVNASGRRINTLRPAQGIDDHAAVTRFLGFLPMFSADECRILLSVNMGVLCTELLFGAQSNAQPAVPARPAGRRQTV